MAAAGTAETRAAGLVRRRRLGTGAAGVVWRQQFQLGKTARIRGAIPDHDDQRDAEQLSFSGPHLLLSYSFDASKFKTELICA